MEDDEPLVVDGRSLKVLRDNLTEDSDYRLGEWPSLKFLFREVGVNLLVE